MRRSTPLEEIYAEENEANADERILSITLPTRAGDTPAKAQKVGVDVLQGLFERGVIIEGAAAMERGRRRDNRHMQIMCLANINIDRKRVHLSVSLLDHIQTCCRLRPGARGTTST